MANTPFMNLSLPIVSTTIGPAWATMLNAALTYIDAHDHSSSKGKPVPSSGLNINAELDLNTNTLFNALSLQFTSQTAALTGATNAASLYAVGGDLYYTNGAGTALQITNGGSINAIPGAAETFAITNISADLTIAPADAYVVINVNTSVSRNIYLPSITSISAGRIFIVVDKTGNSLTAPINIIPNGTDTILSVNSQIEVDSNFSSLMLISDGVSNWIAA